MSMSTEISTPQPPPLPRLVASPQELLRHHNETAAFIQSNLEDGKDYGVIPGTGDKPSLYKPGAERINVAFGVAPLFSITEKEIDHLSDNDYVDKRTKKPSKSRGLYRYVVECRLMLGERVLSTCIGTCSTLESKYISRPGDCENTVLKMAQKRAYVGATLLAYGLSNRFTQDVEDLPREEKPVRPAPPADPGLPYNPDIAMHQHKLKAVLEKAGVPQDFWEEISKEMRGRVLADLDIAMRIVRERPTTAEQENEQGQGSV